VGHGECLMGILDSYPHPYALLPPHVCEALEHDAVSWRWRLRGRTHRLARVHGDFHPWNLLFREGTDFSVLLPAQRPPSLLVRKFVDHVRAFVHAELPAAARL